MNTSAFLRMPGAVTPGDVVRYHPIIGGPDDGRDYTVADTGVIGGGRLVAWLQGKSGCVSLASLSSTGVRATDARGEG